MRNRTLYKVSADVAGRTLHDSVYASDIQQAVRVAMSRWRHAGHRPNNATVRAGRSHANPHPPDRKDVIASRKRTAQRVKQMRRQLKKRKKFINPPQHWYIHIQKHGRGPIMFFNGRSFASKENAPPHPFTSSNAAMYKARHLLGKYHRQLSAYKIWVSDRYMGAATQNTRVNPYPRGIDEAARKLEDFTGHEATHVERAPARSKEKTGLVIGELDQIGYQAAREGIDGGRTARYMHKFRKGSRPLLAVSTDGKQLHVVGGQYEFTEAGIEDR